MRRFWIGKIWIALLCLSSAQMASASSIEIIVSGERVGNSVETITCKHCPPVRVANEPSAEKVPDLPRGQQKIEVRRINGELKVLRTEAWMGGSPVLYVSEPTEAQRISAGEPPRDPEALKAEREAKVREAEAEAEKQPEDTPSSQQGDSSILKLPES